MQNRPGLSDFFNPELRPYDQETYAYLAQKYAYTPASFLADIDVPMLYILAGQDVNIPYVETVARLEHLIELGKPVDYVSFPAANHYLYRWEAFPLEGVYQADYLELLGDWAAGRLEGSP